MKKKKGAIELSMTTIIIIVIGVVLLGLALTWVRSVFNKLGTQTDLVFGEAENQIKNIAEHSERVNTQLTIPLKRGEQENFYIWVVNQLDETKTFHITVQRSTDQVYQNPDVVVGFANNVATLAPGEEVGFVAGVTAPKGASSQSAAFTISVTCDGCPQNAPYGTGGFIVTLS